MAQAHSEPMKRISLSDARLDLSFGSPGFYSVGLLAIFAAYLPILAISFRSGPAELLLTAAANVAPIALLGLAVRQLLRRFVLGRRATVQIAAHAFLALVFTFLWFWLLMVLLGAAAGINAVEFSVRPFSRPAAAWQLFQGLFVYTMVAIAVHAETLAQQALAGAVTSCEPPRPRLFIKQDDEIHPLEPSRIVIVRGADDYSELVTAERVHLVRITLADLADRLGEGFLRVHRSCLVNLDEVAKAESAGSGRMLLHMTSGDVIRTSRAGSRFLRERVI